MKVAFTGHRPNKLHIGNDELSDRGQALQHLIWAEIANLEDAGADTFLCGAAMGADIICGEMILAEKMSINPDLKLICAIPFREQADNWPLIWKMRYRDLLKGSDKIVQVCDEYQRGCYHIRNRFLVDNCDVVLAVYDGEGRGSTAYTVKYAEKRGKGIIILDPNTLQRRVIPSSNKE